MENLKLDLKEQELIMNRTWDSVWSFLGVVGGQWQEPGALDEVLVVLHYGRPTTLGGQSRRERRCRTGIYF
jgi:hypothetical protein